MKLRGVLLLVWLLGGCRGSDGPRVNRLHAVPFQYLNSVQVGMRERELLDRRRAVQHVAPNEYFENVASFGVIYVMLKARLVGVIVPESFAHPTAGSITFTQHQQEAYRSLGVSPICAYEARAHRTIALYKLPNGVHEVMLRVLAPGSTAEVTRSFLLAPSAQWRAAREQPCNAPIR